MSDSDTILLAFKAGRALRRGTSNTVEPSATKGAIALTSNADDGLLHFIWRNRDTNQVEEDLILFPSDASFVKVPQAPSGRVYVLKFSSSDQRHFFWLQDASSARDDEFIRNLNGYLEDPDFSPTWSGSSAGASGSQPFQATQEQIAQLGDLLAASTAGNRTSAADEQLSLSDVVTPANITPLFATHPELISTLFPHLPPDLPVPPSQEVVLQVINSPQFRSSVSNFDQALRTGLLGGLVRGLGLPEEAGTGVGPFLRAVQEKADRDRESGGDRMDTD